MKHVPTLGRHLEPTLPRGSGFVIAGAISMLLWGMIVGVAVLV